MRRSLGCYGVVTDSLGTPRGYFQGPLKLAPLVSKRIGFNVAAALLLAGLTTSAHGQVPGGGFSPFGGESRGMTQFAGKVVCVGCSLEEVQKAHPNQHDLYLLRHRLGQVVMELDTVSERPLWSYLAWPPRLWVRADDKLF